MNIGSKIISRKDFQKLPEDKMLENDGIAEIFPKNKFVIVRFILGLFFSVIFFSKQH